MEGVSINQAKDALLMALDRLQPGDRFNVIEFNSKTYPLYSVPMPLDAQTLADARTFVKNLHARGGTEMLPALTSALSTARQGSEMRQIVFLTDGAVGNENELLHLIEQRLEAWDRLSAETQKEILENELAIRYFAQLNVASSSQRDALLNELPPVQRQKIEAEIARWRALPEDRRERMHQHFRQFFELTEKEREKVLSSFSDAERQQMTPQ